MKRAAVIFFAVIMISMASCGGAPRTEAEPDFPMRGEVPVSEKTVRFLGRYYESEGVYYTNLSCSGFEVRFEGTELKAEFISEPTDADHNTYIHVFVDDDYSALEKTEADGTQDGLANDSRILLEAGRSTVTLASGLEEGVHKITVQKANQSSLNKLGTVKLFPGDGAVLEPPTAKEKSILVIGDSISCGSNNLGEDLAVSYSASEDGLFTMAAYAARHFGADLEVFAKNGLYTSLINTAYDENMLRYADPFNEILAPWDTERPGRQRDLVLINLGINDTNVINSSGGAYSYEQFREDYIRLIQEVRALYPDSYILCTDVSASAAQEQKAVEEYVAQTGDENISFWLRGTVYSRHPLISTHRSEGERLIRELENLGVL
ncbi:MAG TPA: hypothetical protein DEF06_07885 [Clostridiales bacterium]|uniref:SGNH hydrolase-type esterase domain-containing protein n=1 Tax=Candidatus Egerieisoma faecipullorum TaxID=2840963 RepID=A0A9D1I719_9CLOT|nr:hypothetical protein [Clostridiales bacterium]HIU29336.1 hypothetical protein [Candidatus Egerieisoma faecipullorum]